MEVPTLKDYSKLIGTPYDSLDCWGIVVEFYKLVFNMTLKPYYEVVPETKDMAKNLVYSNMKDFKEVFDRKFGDIVLIKIRGIESHIGVYLGNDLILHTQHKTGCLIDRMSRWEKLVVGFYRVKDDSVT